MRSFPHPGRTVALLILNKGKICIASEDLRDASTKKNFFHRNCQGILDSSNRRRRDTSGSLIFTSGPQ
jgi:hypothetical protein